MSPQSSDKRRMLVLGGSLHHRGGLEAFCERTASAINAHSSRWQAEWRSTDTAYLSLRRLGAAFRAWQAVRQIDKESVDLVWLQWSTLADLLFLQPILTRKLPVMVTPHLGANARLQRVPRLRDFCVRLLGGANRLAMLFDGQAGEIALPRDVPQSVLGTFLPQETLAEPIASRAPGAPLRLLHAGRLSAEKGTMRVVELCALLDKRGIPFEAQIVGRADPATMAALVEKIAAAGLGERITLSEWMDGPALRHALGSTDILVHLSELDSFPLIVMEALAAGALPIVAPMAGAASMVRRYDGVVIPANNVGGAAEWLASNSLGDLRARGAEAARRVRDDHAWPEIVAKLEDIADLTTQVN